jgi:vomeronasal 2 receptor
MEEINKNWHILPNIYLVVNIRCGLQKYVQKTGLGLENQELIPNYYCTNQRRYLIVLTAPVWEVSTLFGAFLFISRIPEVSQDGLILRKYFLFLCETF